MSQFIQFSLPNISRTILLEYLLRNPHLEIQTLRNLPCSSRAGWLGAAKARRSNCNGPHGGRTHARTAVRGAARTAPCYPNPGSVTGKPETTICVSTCNFNQISQAVIIDTFEVISVTLYQQCEGIWLVQQSWQSGSSQTTLGT